MKIEINNGQNLNTYFSEYEARDSSPDMKHHRKRENVNEPILAKGGFF